MEFSAFQKHLAATFRVHRAAARLTQTALARAAGTSTQWISEIETAKGQPSLETLWRMAEAMGTTISALTVPPGQLQQAGENGHPDEDLNDLVRHLRRLPPGAVALTRDYVAGLAGLMDRAIPRQVG